MNTEALLNAYDALQARYCDALDSKKMAEWAGLFANQPGATYICRSAENEMMGHEIALMLDDCLARIKDRVTFVTQIWKGTFQDYRTRHFVQRLTHEMQDDGSMKVRSNFHIAYTLDPNPTKTLVAGVYEDVVVMQDGEARFLSRRAIYDTTILPQYIVYPF